MKKGVNVREIILLTFQTAPADVNVMTNKHTSMKLFHLCLLSVLLTGCSKDRDPSKPPISSSLALPAGRALTVLAMGQSNMVYWSPKGEASFKYAMTPQFNVKVVNCAVGGTFIREWLPGTGNLNTCLNAVEHVDAVLFYQGESDSQDVGDYATWSDKFQSIIAEVRSKKGDIPVIYCQIASDPDVYGVTPIVNPFGDRWKHWKEVQDQQALTALSNSAMVRAEGLEATDDHVHLTQDSYIILGEQMARSLKTLL